MKLLALWRLSGLFVAFCLLAACSGGASPSPTTAPAKPAPEPTKPAAAAPAAPAPAPAAAPAAPAAAANPWEMPGAGLVKGSLEGDAKQLTGAGATFPAPLY